MRSMGYCKIQEGKTEQRKIQAKYQGTIPDHEPGMRKKGSVAGAVRVSDQTAGLGGAGEERAVDNFLM